MTHAARGYESVDPAPPAPETDIPSLESRLLDPNVRMFERMRALFTLRAIATHGLTGPDAGKAARGVAALDAIGRCLLEDRSALLRHEAAFIFGQISHAHAVRYLVPALRTDPHPMVRHEAAEALGAVGTPDVEAPLRAGLAEDGDQDVRDSCEVALDHIAYLRDAAQFEVAR